MYVTRQPHTDEKECFYYVSVLLFPGKDDPHVYKTNICNLKKNTF